MAIEAVRGIVTSVVKHSDKLNVVTLYTRRCGRLSALTPAGASRSVRMRNAQLMPLALVEGQVSMTAGRDLGRLGKISTPRVWRSLYANPVKSAMGLFIAEFLNAYLRYSDPDPLLYDYLEMALGRFDEDEKTYANFHIALMVNLLRFAGVFPDIEGWHEGMLFDLRSGEFTDMVPAHRDVLDAETSRFLPVLARIGMRNYRLYKMTGRQRSETLRGLLRYYGVHFPWVGKLKSVEVLEAVFH